MEEDTRDNPFILLLLATLLEKEPQTGVEVQRNLGLSIEWALRVREVAVKGGLTREEDSTEGRRRKLIYLTNDGRKAAIARAEYDAALLRAKKNAARKD